MAVEKIKGSMNVLEAAEQRIKNAFDTGLDVVLSISGGKDSIVLSDIVYSLIERGEVNPKQLIVRFIDEEAIFDDVEKIVLDWRRKFLLIGAKFEWYCIQIKHFNCLNSLDDDESFITWDRFEKENWVRPMPKFAIKTHPLLNDRRETYQTFLERIALGFIQLIGIRTAESAMRAANMATIFGNTDNAGGLANNGNKMFPIYDWEDDDIWLHIKNRGLDFPKTYMDLWAVGQGRRGMRISQFFSIDTAKVLVKLNEHQPGLMEKVVKREPNAYLASLYWDTALFGNAPRKKKDNTGEGEIEKLDYKSIVLKLVSNIDDNFHTPVKIKTAKTIRSDILKFHHFFRESDWKDAFLILQTGDPKNRATRGFRLGVLSNSYDAGKERNRG